MFPKIHNKYIFFGKATYFLKKLFIFSRRAQSFYAILRLYPVLCFLSAASSVLSCGLSVPADPGDFNYGKYSHDNAGIFPVSGFRFSYSVF